MNKDIIKEFRELYGDDFEGGFREKIETFILKALKEQREEDMQRCKKAKCKTAVTNYEWGQFVGKKEQKEDILKKIEESTHKHITYEHFGSSGNCIKCKTIRSLTNLIKQDI